jgi:hypothetical protein
MINIVIIKNNESDYIVFSTALVVAVYALFEANWPLVACMVLITSGYRRIMRILGLSKVIKQRHVLSIFEDAGVQLRSGDEIILEGMLNDQQWCAGHLAVLNICAEGKTHYFAAISAQQTDRCSFRRLKARLRHNFYRDAGGVQESGN